VDSKLYKFTRLEIVKHKAVKEKAMITRSEKRKSRQFTAEFFVVFVTARAPHLDSVWRPQEIGAVVLMQLVPSPISLTRNPIWYLRLETIHTKRPRGVGLTLLSRYPERCILGLVTMTLYHKDCCINT